MDRGVTPKLKASIADHKTCANKVHATWNSNSETGYIFIFVETHAMIEVALWQWGCTVRCAKSRLFWTIFPNGQGERSNYCVPIHRTTQILTQSNNSDDELERTIFPTKHARLLSKSAVFALWT